MGTRTTLPDATALNGRTLKWPPLSTITVPTLVINGEEDPVLQTRAGRDTARQIAGATFVSYPGMGHNLPEELWPDIIERIVATTRRASSSAPA